VRGMRGGGFGGFRGYRGPGFRPGTLYRRPLLGWGPLFWGIGFLFAPVLGVMTILALALLSLIVR
jgi:hypothetical protein